MRKIDASATNIREKLLILYVFVIECPGIDRSAMNTRCFKHRISSSRILLHKI